MTHLEALSAIADRQAIATNLARHSRGVDRNDLALLRSVYHDDAEVSYGLFDGPAADMAAYLTGAMLGQPVTLHRTGHMWIETENDRARSESYVIAYLSTPGDGGEGGGESGDGQVQRLIGGRYLDRHERRDGVWRIAHRTYVMDWNSNRPGSGPPPFGSASPLAAFAPRGGQLGQDPGTTLLALWKTRQDQQTTERTTDMQPQDIDAVVARDAIHQLSVAYCRGVDRADAALIRSVFHDDGSFVGAGMSGSADDFAVATAELVRTAFRTSFHSIANEWVEVKGDHAIGEIYVIAFSRTQGGGEDGADQDNFIGGRYLDRYERRGGVWKIAERVFVQDWMTTHASTHQDDGMYAQLPTRGGFAPDDPVYAFWTA
ncbi:MULTISPECIES: nuclear transport factor 2 family protein [unclassified Sphingomonas]|uniref:nuclear transport factor 2 family protein n=1 Tax=unclassified Sphingomonas TaxID=196159 RepID=UPI0006F57856|nr:MULTISPECIES: nuclear transport factor 2 family protein [unclassified Sphingomonas]KQX19452.1 hypothetical protein ASD17_13045 [Sphingomonas sp. Root1294]KQY65653.1 hypothetical protein ASD39_16245 [Sphingomonas sp. Root50]KRB95043.1 hypothetical protein ASE22_03810 [Sphingomonas sp. Root720]